jgi:hypothetical protein
MCGGRFRDLSQSLRGQALRTHERVLFGVLAAFSVVPLVVLVVKAGIHDLVFAGVDGPYPADQFQYLSWIRQSGRSLLVANELDIASSDHVFLHPMFLPSGLLTRAGVSVPLSYLLWKPVAVIALFLGFRAYVTRFVGPGWTRIATLATALFCAAPAAALMWWMSFGSGSELFSAVARVTAEMFPAELTWGYLHTVIAVALMPVLLLSAERLGRPGREDLSHRRRDILLAAGSGATISWLHPWQGEVMLIVLVAAVVIGRFERRYLAVAIPVIAVSLPLGYYFVLSRADLSWKIAQQSNAAAGQGGGHVPVLAVALVLAPFLIPAFWGLRGRSGDFGERMLVLWLPATAAVYLFSTQFPQHAFEGLSLPLAVLALRGLARTRRPLVWTLAFAVAVTLPGAARGLQAMREDINSGQQPFFLKPAEDRALAYLERERAPGGVLPSAYLGPLVPVRTGRQTWVGHPTWTRDYDTRVRETGELFRGRMAAARAVALVRSSRAAFVLADCNHRGDLLRLIKPIVMSVRRFGCADVYRVRGGRPGLSALGARGA